MKLIMSTCQEKEAERLSGRLLEERLVACVNIIHGISSRYWWKGKMESDTESLLLMKTKPSLVDDVIKRIKVLHAYEVPEIIVLEIEDGNPDYLRWIGEVTV
ncbi:divalent-cation tolerance protein CutA [bacterium]|nr:divalent-cation tolerance protein CutA [bacterium]